jgi:hypothetical protein
MDLIDRLRDISSRIPRLKQEGLIRTEEGTKNALIMPFINALGYNVFDPTEVTPELIADVGIKKGEKVDYAILRKGQPIILFECKCFGADLSQVHASQLYRYFSVTSARFGVLTDGVIYRFYTDLDNPNKMDENPFFIFDMTEIKEAKVEELKKFTKSSFDEDDIMTAASELKYKGLITSYLHKEMSTPSDELTRHLAQASGAYGGRFTQSVIDDFRAIVRSSFRGFINEQVENRLKSALASEQQKALPESSDDSPQDNQDNRREVVTTEEEVEAFQIIRSILREVVDVKRIAMRDALSYCAILLDDNNRRTIARLYFSANRMRIGIFDENRKEIAYQIETIDDIFNYASQLKTAIMAYLTNT